MAVHNLFVQANGSYGYERLFLCNAHDATLDDNRFRFIVLNVAGDDDCHDDSIRFSTDPDFCNGKP